MEKTDGVVLFHHDLYHYPSERALSDERCVFVSTRTVFDTIWCMKLGFCLQHGAVAQSALGLLVLGLLLTRRQLCVFSRAERRLGP